MDAKNTFTQHTIVGIFSLGLVFIFRFLLNIHWSTSFSRTSFILLFLLLIIGPIMKLKKPAIVSSPLKTPWTWRGELGIWFFLTALAHSYFIMSGRPNWSLIKVLGGGIGGGGYGFANFLGLIALFWAFVLAATSFGKIIGFLGIESWKWLHSFTYVIFYLVTGHLIYFQFFSTYGEVGPDWFGWMALIMAILVIILQLSAFIKTVVKHRGIQNENHEK